tara:strand:+ start:8613 stop:9266 length:654 start_codon:yes stop_codon:yes gene_type:complete
MKNEQNTELKISSVTLDFGLDFVHGKKENKMNTNTKTYIADGNGVTTSEFYSVEKPSRKKFKKFNEAFLNELNREELFIGALGLRMLEETDEASNLDYVQEEVKNIYGRTIRKIRTYSDGSVQIFQVVAKVKNRHFYNGSTFKFITRLFKTGSNEPVLDGKKVATRQKTFYGSEMANLKSHRELNRNKLSNRMAIVKRANKLASYELENELKVFGVI